VLSTGHLLAKKKNKLKKMNRLKRMLFQEAPYVKVEDKNRFYYMLQQMQANRWRITGIVLFLFFFIIFGINMAVMFQLEIAENWKEMLLILFGAFVGNLNKVVDYWFNSEDRDKMLIQKVDEEDGSSLSSVTEYPTTPRPPQEPIIIIRKEEVVSEPVVEEPVAFHNEPVVEPYEEPAADVYEEPADENYTEEYTEGTEEEKA
jgi:hypothetical protein